MSDQLAKIKSSLPRSQSTPTTIYAFIFYKCTCGPLKQTTPPWIIFSNTCKTTAQSVTINSSSHQCRYPCCPLAEDRTMKSDNAHPNQPLPMEIVHWLSGEIQSGRLATGDQLPSERQLCEQFSVSRAVVREALSQLKFEELITTQQGKGAFVAKRGERHAFRLKAVSLGEGDALLHILEFLITIEVGATPLAALRHTPEDLKKIRQ